MTRSNPGPYRLARGGVLDRTRQIAFRFDRQVLRGHPGDSVASALLANGVRIVSRSFKFHRPRGIFSAGFEEPNALVQLHSGARAVPSARATLVPLAPDLEVFSQSGWPSLSRDVLRAIDFVHPLFAAGFYNKTFMWPRWSWYEPIIRKLAGFGRMPGGADPDRYDTYHEHCDVLVVGGGKAGVEAARRAADARQRVVLVEQQETFEGDVAELQSRSDVRCLLRTTAVAYYDHDLVALVESVDRHARAHVPRERLWLVRARRVVLATGRIEQPLVFCNNDRPGVMLAGAALKYLRRHGVAPGRRVLIATNGNSAYETARELCEHGVNLIGMLDSRREVPAAARAALCSFPVEISCGWLPIDTAGFGGLSRVTAGHLAPNAQCIESRRSYACDALLVSGGSSPVLHLFAQAGGRLVFDAVSGSFVPAGRHPSIEIAGSASQSPEPLGPRLSPVGNPARMWVDLLHDVTAADIQLAVRENFKAVEHIKRYTTLGMSADQGKVGQAPAAEVIAHARGIPAEQIGHTTFRPPFMPVTVGTLVGRGVGQFYAPERHSVLHALQADAGALFDDFGEWRRAAAFPRRGESREQAMYREARLVRNGLGIYDASPLGKIELAGPDALEFADRFYINNLASLRPGRTRYGLMLRETGSIFDDGTIAVLDEDRILLTTTSSGANRVATWLEEWRQCEWPDLRVVVASVTDQWATVALTGQNARNVLTRLKPECDLSNEGFPHLSMRVTRLLGHEARIYRVSFSGELTYEINVPAHVGPQLWASLREEGREFDIEPYGVDALLHLRMEKGFIHIGADTDGTTVPDDIGFGKAAAAKSRHYVGKRSLTLPENVRPDRLQLIGLTGEGGAGIPTGSHLRLPDSEQATDGWVTSAGSLTSDRTPVGMALLRTGRSQMGRTVTVHDGGRIVTKARVVTPMFYDPSGARMNG